MLQTTHLDVSTHLLAFVFLSKGPRGLLVSFVRLVFSGFIQGRGKVKRDSAIQQFKVLTLFFDLIFPISGNQKNVGQRSALSGLLGGLLGKRNKKKKQEGSGGRVQFANPVAT